jgi:imidazolonepropionase-like amidohydrolase
VPRAVERQDRVESAATASPEYETAEAQVVRRFGVTTATLLHVDRLPVLVGSRMLMALSRIIVSMLVALVALDARARDVLVISGGTIIDTRTRQVLENHTVVVQDGRITKVGPAPEITTPLTAQVVDASGLWLFPGLIDMHVHGSSRSDVPLSLYVANGVTAVRDLGGPLTLLQRVRRELEAGTRVGPRLYFAGPLLDSDSPAVPTITIIANTRARAISAVNFLIDQGVDAIKVYNGISETVLQTIVRTARRRNIPVVGHVPRAITASRAVRLGLDGIEHSPIRAVDLESWGMLTTSDANRIRASPSVTVREAMTWQHVDLNSPQVGALVAQLAAAKTFLDPTLSIDEFDSLFLYSEQGSHPNNRFLKRSLVEEALGTEHQILKVPSELVAVARAGVEKRRAFLALCHRAGVKVIAGTDGPGIGTLAPGFGLHRELELLVTAGLTPLDALRAATFDAATALGYERHLGSIEEGKFADIVIVKADPRLNIEHAALIETVILRGRLLDRQALNSMLVRAANEARGQK